MWEKRRRRAQRRIVDPLGATIQVVRGIAIFKLVSALGRLGGIWKLSIDPEGRGTKMVWSRDFRITFFIHYYYLRLIVIVNLLSNVPDWISRATPTDSRWLARTVHSGLLRNSETTHRLFFALLSVSFHPPNDYRDECDENHLVLISIVSYRKTRRKRTSMRSSEKVRWE